MVLLAVIRLTDDAYAVPIRNEIRDQADRRVSRGALYTTLERMETKGYLESRMGNPAPTRGGRARRYYTVTPLGRACLDHSRIAMANLWRGVVPTSEDTA